MIETKDMLISALKYRDRNPRRGNVAMIKQSLEKNGLYRPIVVKRDTLEVLAGNHTLKAAQELGWEEITCSLIDCDDETAARIVLVDNKSNDAAGYDNKLLAEILDEMPDLAGTGWNMAEVEELVDAQLKGEGRKDPDEVPDLPVEPQTKLGDRWLLGEHVLVCGDSTLEEDVQRLMAGEKARLFLTDAPYGVSLADKNNWLQEQGYNPPKSIATTEIAGDSEESEDMLPFWTKCYANALLVCDDHASYYIFSPQGGDLMMMMMQSIEAAGWQLKHTIIWVKSHLAFGRCDYHYKHEPIFFGYKHEPVFYGWKKKGGHTFYGEPTEVSVWEESVWNAKSRNNNDLHPTMKPVELMERAIKNSSQVGEIVLDLFGGSGSTLIACERLGRKCRMMEIDPGYVDVIVKRWKDYTGKTPVLEGREQDG